MMKGYLDRKGNDRVRQRIRQSLTMVAITTAKEGTRTRAYELLCDFLQKANQSMQFNMNTLWTRQAFGKVARMFQTRQVTLANKKKHVRDLWDREVQIMMHACQHKAKQKKYKALYVKLA